MKNFLAVALLLFAFSASAQMSVSTKINEKTKMKLQESPREFLSDMSSQKLLGYVSEGEKRDIGVEYYALITYGEKEMVRTKPQKGTMFPGTILFPGNILFPGTILDKMENGQYELIFFINTKDPSFQKEIKNWPGKMSFRFSF